MADGAPPGTSRAEAAQQVGRWLEANIGAVPLGDADVPSSFIEGWSFVLAVGGEQLKLRFFLDTEFPHSEPRIGFAEPPAFPSYPHVEHDGLICVLTSRDVIDPNDPVGVAQYVLKGAADILEQGIAGKNSDDFRREFLSYWVPLAKGTPVLSLLDPSEPTRAIAIWPGKGRTVAAENEKELRAWAANRYGKRSMSSASAHTGLLIWLDRPLLPDEYPETPEALFAIADAAGAGDLLDRTVARSTGSTLVLLGAETGDGACFAGVTLRGGPRGHRRGRSRGFRTTKMDPRHARLMALAGHAEWSAVGRADPRWIHGRDANPDIDELMGSRVAIVGCGSLGSPVARLLAQAGVGTIDLVDPETLDWPNISRHALGAASVHGNKAEQLAAELGRSFPHSRFVAHPKRWQDCIPALEGRDTLVISTVGDWRAESLLHLWQLEDVTRRLIYGWCEPHGVAGHGVLVAKGSGCLQCGLDTMGGVRGTVSEWPASTLRRVPACGAHFQPYGAAAIMTIAAMVSDLAIDVLLAHADAGEHRIAAAPLSAVTAEGGTWSAAWAATAPGDDGARSRRFRWLPTPACPACQGGGIR